MKLSRKYLNVGAFVAVIVGLSTTSVAVASSSSTPFKHPSAIALDRHGRLWVANQDSFGITEIQASTGQVLRVIDAKRDGFIDPTGIAVVGNDVWIVSGGVTYRNGTSHVGNVTELNDTTGALVRTVSLKDRGITGLSAVAADANDIWIVADGGSRVAELSNATGKIVRIHRGRSRVDESSGIAVGGGHVWIPDPEVGDGVVERSAVNGLTLRTITPTTMEVPLSGGSANLTYLGPQYVSVDSRFAWTANQGSVTTKLVGGSVTQINPMTGKIVRTIDSTADRFWGTIHDITTDGRHVWITNGTSGYRNQRRGDTVTELNAANGSLVRVITLHNGPYSDPVGVVSNGVDVWVADQGGGSGGIGSVVELNAATGKTVRIIQG